MRRAVVLILLFSSVLCAQQEALVAASRRGKQLMAAGRYAEAAKLYQGLVKKVPGNPGLLLNLGLAHHLAGQDHEAVQNFQAALKIQPGILPALLFLGAAYLRLGEPAKAEPPLEKVVASQPGMKQAREWLGEALTGLKRYQQAAEQYREWTSLDGANPRAWYGLGSTYDALAEQAFTKLQQTAPESPYLGALVADVQLTEHRYPSAFYLYKQVLAKRPDFPGAHAVLAKVYRGTQHPDWAAREEAAQRAVPPPDCKLHQLECVFRSGDYRRVISLADSRSSAEALYWKSRAANQLARAAYERLGRLPESVEMHVLLARMHNSQGRPVEAVKQWRAALKLAPGDPDLQLELAMSLHNGRDDKGAQAILRSLLKKGPNSARINFLYGDTFLNMQQAAKALPYLRKSVRLDPNYLPARSSLGRAYLQLKQGVKAIPHLKAALTLDRDGSLHFQLARAYQENGQREEAKRVLAVYQQIRRKLDADRRFTRQERRITPPGP